MSAARAKPGIASRTGVDVFRAIAPPRPVLDKDREASLTERQRDLLLNVERLLFAEGFSALTMSALAGRLQCSLRTLYALSPSRDELVLIAVDRNLWRVGRSARDAIPPDATPFESVRHYLGAAMWAIAQWTEPFARDLAMVSAARELEQGHTEYLFEVTRAFLDAAVANGDIPRVDTVAIARVLAGLGRLFTRPSVLPTLLSSPKEAADEMVDLVLAGLAAHR